MARADQDTIKELRAMLAKQLEIENDWYNLKYKVTDTDLKDSISDALSKCRDRFQFLLDSF